MRCFWLVGWLLGISWLGGCQPNGPTSTRITAENYLTAIPDPKTLGEAYVSDPDHVLDPGTAPALNARLDSLDRSGRAHLDVVLVRSLGETVPKTAATALFNKWQIGRKATNNGLLMLLVLDQRRVEFETGYGLEADLPDIICFRIQQRYMLEPARAGDYDGAVRAGVAALIRRLRPAAAKPVLANAADSLQFKLDSLQQAFEVTTGQADAGNDPLNTAQPGEEEARYYTPPEPGPPIGTLVVGLLALLVYLRLWYCTTQGVRGRGWLVLGPLGALALLLVPALQDKLATGAFLGLAYGLPWLYLHTYFGLQYWRARCAVAPADRPEAYGQRQAAHRGLGFTAVLFPAGLALYWPWYRRQLVALREAPFTCPECALPMHRLASAAELPHLNPAQQIEEASRAIDYDVWECPSGHHLRLAYPNPESSTTLCPACQHRTLPPPHLRVVQRSTTTAEGWGWRVATCRFCQHEEQTKATIPRRSPPASRSAAGGSAAGGSSSSSSWGSISGGSSSGSSSSTSSGGSSGGGGAGSSW